MSIKSFAQKSLQMLFENGFHKQIPKHMSKRLIDLLDFLNAAQTKQDLNIPGAGLHALKGDRQETYAWKVTANWRLTFHFENGDATDVNLEDYH